MSYTIAYCWRVSPLVLDEELMQATWCYENNGILSSDKIVFFLTDKNREVAIKYLPRIELRAYGFALPDLVLNGFKNARLGDCEGCLYISYYNSYGFWVWIHANKGKTVTSEAWIPLLEISHFRQLAKPLAMERLCNVLNAGIPIVPLAFHPNSPVVFLRIKSHVVSYDLAKDKFDTITVAGEIEQETSTIFIPYTPCLALAQDSSKADLVG